MIQRIGHCSPRIVAFNPVGSFFALLVLLFILRFFQLDFRVRLLLHYEIDPTPFGVGIVFFFGLGGRLVGPLQRLARPLCSVRHGWPVWNPVCRLTVAERGFRSLRE